MNLKYLTLEVLSPYTGLNEESVRNYQRARDTSLPLLKNRIIHPFEVLLKEQSGFTDTVLPVESTKQSYTHGDITFIVESSKRTKKPQWKTVFEGLQDYLEFIKEGHLQEISRKGVRTFSEGSYILLDDVLSRYGELAATVTVDALVQKISHDGTTKLQPVAVPLFQEITLTEASALLYVAAEISGDYLKQKVIKPLEDQLKSETGWDRNNRPARMDSRIVSVKSNLCEVLFEVITIPEQTVRYESIIADLVKEPPQRVTKRSKIGDLQRIKLGLPLDTNLYDSRSESGAAGNKYISVEGMLQRLRELRTEHTNPSINQKVDGPYSVL